MKCRGRRQGSVFKVSIRILFFISIGLHIGVFTRHPSLLATISDDGRIIQVPPQINEWASVTSQEEQSSFERGGVCDGYAGVLLIQSGDKGAAAGTLFFQYVINQLIYAEMYNLIPWIHLNNISASVYDTQEHGGPSASFPMKCGDIEMISDRSRERFTYPGPVKNCSDQTTTTVTIAGTNGVWGSYFEPVSSFQIDDPSCKSQTLVTLTYSQLTPGIHFHAPWAVRSWQYMRSPQYLRPRGVTLSHWYYPMRERAAAVVRKYYRVKPWLQAAVDDANPIDDPPCLGMHIRWSDKGGLARKRIPLDDYLPYAQAFVNAGGMHIYLATDSTVVQNAIQQDWPSTISQKMRFQKGVIQSGGKKAVFNMAAHHRTNTEILTEIYSLARCRLLLHGFSAVSEATIYLNLALHNRSVDLEDPNHMDLEEFRKVAKDVLNNNG